MSINHRILKTVHNGILVNTMPSDISKVHIELYDYNSSIKKNIKKYHSKTYTYC